MVPYAERAVAATQDAENAVRALTQNPMPGRWSLAVVGTLAGGRLFGIFLRRFARECPDVDLCVAHGDQRRSQRSHPAWRCHHRLALRPRSVRAISIMSVCPVERLQVVCAKDHPLAGRRVARIWPISAANAGSHFPTSGTSAKSRPRTSSRFFRLYGLGEVGVGRPVDSLTAQKRLVEAGLGIALLSQSNVADELRSSSIEPSVSTISWPARISSP